MDIKICFVSDDGRDGTFDPQSGRLELFDRADEYGDVYGSNIFAGVKVVSVDENRSHTTSELAPGRYVEFTSSSGFVFEFWVVHVAVVIDGETVWEGSE